MAMPWMTYAPTLMVAPADGFATSNVTIDCVGVVTEVLGVVVLVDGVVVTGVVGVVETGAVGAVDGQVSVIAGTAPLAEVSPATVVLSPIATGIEMMNSWPVTLECA